MNKRRSFITGIKSTSLLVKERHFLKKYKPWGVILFSRNIKSISQTKKLTQEILNLWLSKPLCKDSSNHDFFKELSIKLNESENQIKKL